MSVGARISQLAASTSGYLVKNRHRLPKFVNRAIDDVAKNPDGMLSRVASVLLGGTSKKRIPAATSVPETEIRVYIGPTNYSGQGYLWARALEQFDSRIGARNMAVELPGGFAFPADSLVPVAVYNASAAWQNAELESAGRFTHALFEAERPLFGRLLKRSVRAEIEELSRRGVSSAFLCHGTDVRSPRTHMALNRWSPFVDDPHTELLQADADANLALLAEMQLPVFVSTPDLFVDVPGATWCPVVVDAEKWSTGRELFAAKVPVVVHIPSMGPTKGTHLIEPALRSLHDAGKIEFRTVTGVPSNAMPKLIGDADIVLDQFRIGSYGVAACEAMAAGRVVVGHILPQVRDRIRQSVGLDLPIVEAEPDSLEDVLLQLLSERESAAESAASGEVFVRQVHTGSLSAKALSETWISR